MFKLVPALLFYFFDSRPTDSLYCSTFFIFSKLYKEPTEQSQALFLHYIHTKDQSYLKKSQSIKNNNNNIKEITKKKKNCFIKYGRTLNIHDSKMLIYRPMIIFLSSPQETFFLFSLPVTSLSLSVRLCLFAKIMN